MTVINFTDDALAKCSWYIILDPHNCIIYEGTDFEQTKQVADDLALDNPGVTYVIYTAMYAVKSEKKVMLGSYDFDY